ncbi:carbamoyltransferase family protein [Parenemella sanctibonifatiensis]|uniref:Carbamoyltransferase n=1 Tax=Parenemella sanctibonifatiensis TaxID=2016505 RepID=A0A255EF32_9ACTN|nr:carbamoyltransferase C-terminal domain-containing protein [Parenemella sanctibonifatiensis]OYN88185.1 hypothetical protein CGZ91_13875 [Parenemella sanctibonifatiensis]
MMAVLGIANDMWVSSAALVSQGRVVSAVSEERLNRIKHFRGFPRQAIESVLKHMPVGDSLKAVAISANPMTTLPYAPSRQLGSSRFYAETLYSVPANLSKVLGSDWAADDQLELASGGVPLKFITHHMAHAAAAHYQAESEDNVILTLDGRGERQTGTICTAEGNRITLLQEMNWPHSLGLFYGAITDYLGFRLDLDEYKIMGLAAYGDSKDATGLEMADLVRLVPGGMIELDLNYFDFYLSERELAVSRRFLDRFGPPRKRSEKVDARHAAVALAAQKVLEAAVVHCASTAYDLGGKRDSLAVSGGTFMNSAMNGRLGEATPFKYLYIPSAPDDAGTAIGAALFVEGVRSTHTVPVESALGPLYDDADLRSALERCRVRYTSMDDVGKEVARLISGGKLVGWYHGRSEFGARALGHRSILADPRDPASKDRVNAAVKFREGFRPFAPAVLSTEWDRLFESAHTANSVYMQQAIPMRPQARAALPSVVHVDGTSRAQFVPANCGSPLAALLGGLKAVTGWGVVLNTSFNLADEPIVETPDDAIRTFYSCGLDALALGPFLVTKDY